MTTKPNKPTRLAGALFRGDVIRIGGATYKVVAVTLELPNVIVYFIPYLDIETERDWYYLGVPMNFPIRYLPPNTVNLGES
jgi:hypothetical protein